MNQPRLMDRLREAIVLGRDLDWLEGVIRAKRSRRLPVVLSREEVRRILREMTGMRPIRVPELCLA